MANRTIKTVAAMGALMLGAAYAAEPAAEQLFDDGTYTVDVETIAKVWLSGNSTDTKTLAEDILHTIKTAKTPNTAGSPLELEFTVKTNLEKWDLDLTTANNGVLKRAVGGASVPLSTDLTPDGSLGNGGSLYVSLESVDTEGTFNVTPIVGRDVDVSTSNTTAVKLANEAFGEDEFESEGLVEAIFKVRAGLAGNTVTAPPGTYTETVTLTLTSNLIN